MSLQAFTAAIESEALRHVVEHWNEARGSRRMPAWRDIRPAAIKAQLPLVWSWKYDRDADQFTGRIAGDRIQTVFGSNPRGVDMKDAFPAPDFDKVFARLKKALATPAFFRGYGLVSSKLDRYDIGERIILPLAEDGATGDGIFGVTAFESSHGNPPEDVLHLAEIEEWYALE